MGTELNTNSLSKSRKSRFWQAIYYPESWDLEKLISLNIPVAISPLHDSDVIPDTGEIKKPHYHVIFQFYGPTTRSLVQDFVEESKGNKTTVESCYNSHASVQYLCHLNNPEKAQYNVEDITTYNGFELSKYLKKEKSEITIHEIITFIKQENIRTFHDLVIKSYDLHPEYIDKIFSRAYGIKEFLRGC